VYKIVFGKKFLKLAEKLDQPLKSRLKDSLDILSENPFNKTLHTKSLYGKLSGYHSFRLGKDYRVIFEIVSSDTIYLLKIGDRKDIYR